MTNFKQNVGLQQNASKYTTFRKLIINKLLFFFKFKGGENNPMRSTTRDQLPVSFYTKIDPFEIF